MLPLSAKAIPTNDNAHKSVSGVSQRRTFLSLSFWCFCLAILIAGIVKLMFQSCEERGFGFKLMLDDGLIEHPKVDAAFAIHIIPDQEASTVSIHEGIVSQATDSYIVDIQGNGGHSSQPHNTIDTNMIMNQLYTSLNLLFTRETDSSAHVTFSVSAMSGLTDTNVILDKTLLQRNMRSYDQAIRDYLCKRIPEIIDHTGKA